MSTDDQREQQDEEQPRARHPLERPWVRVELIRKLAQLGSPHAVKGQTTQRQLARHYGVTDRAMTLFKQRHEYEIADVKRDMENRLSALWISDRENRLASYQDLYEQLSDVVKNQLPNGTQLFDAEGEPVRVVEVDNGVVRTAAHLLRNVAEEMGHLRQIVDVNAKVNYTINGIDPEKLQ